MAALDRPSAISARTSRSLPVSVPSESARLLAANSWRTTSASRTVPPRATLVIASMKSLDVGDPVLQQVADAGGELGEQFGRRARLDVLGEDQHADPGVVAADRHRRAQALVGVRRRHAHVDDRDVRLVTPDRQQQRVGVPTAATTSCPRRASVCGEPVAHDRRVLGDHDP